MEAGFLEMTSLSEAALAEQEPRAQRRVLLIITHDASPHRGGCPSSSIVSLSVKA